jgi:CBS domain-containing protein
MSRVRDIVRNRELFSVEEGCTVAAAVRRMAELHVGAILVLDRGNLRGVFSERDLMRRVVLEGLDPAGTRVEQVMSTAVVTVDEGASLEEAMELMHTHACRHLPVTTGSSVTAFLSMRDLMNFELARKTEELHHMRSYIAGS